MQISKYEYDLEKIDNRLIIIVLKTIDNIIDLFPSWKNNLESGENEKAIKNNCDYLINKLKL